MDFCQVSQQRPACCRVSDISCTSEMKNKNRTLFFSCLCQYQVRTSTIKSMELFQCKTDGCQCDWERKRDVHPFFLAITILSLYCKQVFRTYQRDRQRNKMWYSWILKVAHLSAKNHPVAFSRENGVWQDGDMGGGTYISQEIGYWSDLRKKKRCCIWFEAQVTESNSCCSSTLMCDGSLTGY